MRVLFNALWPDTARPGAITVWSLPGRESLHLPLRRLIEWGDEDDIELAEETAGHDVYFGLGLRIEGLEPTEQGRVDDIVALPGFVVDIDFFDPQFPNAHKAKNLPRSIEEAAPFFDGLPDPSAVVYSGNGIQAYHFFREPVVLETSTQRQRMKDRLKQWQNVFVSRGKELGWHVDDVATLPHVFRLPGFTHQKTGRQAKLLYCDASLRYELSDLDFRAPEKDASPRTTTTATATPPQTLNERVTAVLAGNQGPYKAMCEKILRGESFAERGGRDDALQRVCSVLAGYRELWSEDPAAVVEILRPSLSVWASEEDATRTLDEETEKACDKYERSKEDLIERDEKQRPLLAGLAKALGLKNGSAEKAPVNFMLQHAIVQYRSTYYVYDFSVEQYTLPRIREELVPCVRDAWNHGRAPDDLSLYYQDERQKKKTKTLARLCEEYARLADHAIGDMTIPQSHFDPNTSVFYEAMAKKRVVEPELDPKIDEWLRLLAGPEYEKVCDWLAILPKLQHQLCALYFDGASGAGKGLFGRGLARLWHEGPPTDFVNVLDNFNSPVKDCPLLWIDEGLPERRGNVSAKIRAWIGSSSFELKEKYLAPRVVNGCVRLLICANNSNVLDFGGEQLSVNDLEAVVGRFLYVRARDEAARWLEENNVGGKLTRAWVEGNGIARHCLALAENRRVKPGKRFLVEGAEASLHRQLVLQGEVNGLIYEWLARFATKPEELYIWYRGKSTMPLALIGDGGLFVNTQCVIDCWTKYMGERQLPSTSRIGTVLSRVSNRSARLGPRDQRVRYHMIKADMVLEWSRQYQVGNEDEIRKNLALEIAFDLGEVEE